MSFLTVLKAKLFGKPNVPVSTEDDHQPKRPSFYGSYGGRNILPASSNPNARPRGSKDT